MRRAAAVSGRTMPTAFLLSAVLLCAASPAHAFRRTAAALRMPRSEQRVGPRPEDLRWARPGRDRARRPVDPPVRLVHSARSQGRRPIDSLPVRRAAWRRLTQAPVSVEEQLARAGEPAWLAPHTLLNPRQHRTIRRAPITSTATPLEWNPENAISEARRVELGKRLARSAVHVESGRGLGSGFVATEEGWIITNHHVVEETDLSGIFVTVGDRKVPAEVIAMHPDLDIAVLQPTVPLDVPALPIANEHPDSGRSVFAYGSPRGLQGSLTEGIVSAIRAQHAGESVRGLIQTDTLIAPGNSGGPLVDATGTVVGINTFKFADDAGLNFAVSGPTLHAFLSAIRAGMEHFDREPTETPPEQHGPTEAPDQIELF